jgi:hypothetical protein
LWISAKIIVIPHSAMWLLYFSWNWSLCLRERDLIICPWFKQRHRMYMLSFKQCIYKMLWTVAQSLGSQYEIPTRLCWRGQHWLESKCCCYGETNSVWKLFNHTTYGSAVDRYQSCLGTCFLHLQEKQLLHSSGHSRCLQNTGNCLPYCTVLHLRRLCNLKTHHLWEPKVSVF